MSGIKRKIEGNDPDYEEISQVHEKKRNKVVEQNAREATVQKMEAIIKEQFSLEMKNKEHEIEVIGQRLNEARRMMDKLRACIVASYYASAGQPKAQEASKSDVAVLNHPAIKRFLDSPSRSSSPLNQGSEAASLGPSDSELLGQHAEGSHGDHDKDSSWRESRVERRPGRNTGKDTFGVPASTTADQHVTYHSTGDEASRLYIKKTIVVGNVSKYIAPDKREENDQSTHKWMVYVRGSKKEPSIDHFVRKVWFFLHPSYKPNDLVEVSEPPFHLTRRGWGEFPVRVQIHFKDPRNKRIDIIHHLKLDRTYTGLQTLGAETVVDVELHRNSLGEDFLPAPLSASSNSFQRSGATVAGSSGASSSHTNAPLPAASSTLSLGLLTQEAPPTPEKGSPTAKQSTVAHGTRSPAPKFHTGSVLSSGVKVIIKQEPGEVPTQSQLSPQPGMVSTATSQQQQQTSSAMQQFVAVKGGHVITMSSSQKQGGGASGTGATSSKVLGIPMGSTLQSAVKQVAISSGGQILVAKSSQGVSKVMTQKQVVAQGVAKAIVSGNSGASGTAGGGASGIVGQQVHTVTKAVGGSSGGGKSGVMATLQLPANNLANLANLPPGTKLYLTTNSKNPSGKGKLLLIPQGAILRASGSGQQSQSASSSSSSSGSGSSQGSSSTSSGSNLPSNLSYTSYILKQTPQGTFLVGQPGGAGKQSSSGPSGHTASGSSSAGQQSIRVTAGQKAAILAQVVGGSQGSHVKLSDGSVKTMPASATATHLSKPGTTTLRMTGGVITATSTTPSPHATATATTPTLQTADGVVSYSAPSSSSSSSSSMAKSISQQHSLLVAANQAAVISAAKNAAAAKANTGAMVTVAKSMAANMPAMIGLSKGVGSGVGQAVVGGARGASPSLVAAAASLVTGTGKASAALSGTLKLHAGQSSSQQAVLTIPATQLKQLSVGTSTGPGTPTSTTTSTTTATSTGVTPSILVPVGKVKTEPGVYSCTGGSGPQTPTSSSTPVLGTMPTTATASVKVEQGIEPIHELNIEHIENLTQLLTAAVKKYPLIVPEKNEDSQPFCAISVEQYYSWNIGKRRAAELQRAVAVRRVVQEVLERSPRLQALPVAPPRTRQVAQWCRHRGYTPPDPEPRRTQEDSIEDILTQIDSEPECPSTLRDAEELCQRVEQLQRLLKTEPEEEEEEEDGEPLDVLSLSPPCISSSEGGSGDGGDANGANGDRSRPKQEPQGGAQEPSYHLGPSPAQQFIRDTAEQIGVSLQPTEVEKNVFAPVLEAMLLKATEQFASDVLREALANAYVRSPQNRAPREVTVTNVHQSVSSIPACDFLTNRHMGIMYKENGHSN